MMYDDWIKANEDVIVERFMDFSEAWDILQSKLDRPVLDDDFLDLYADHITIDDVPEEILSAMYQKYCETERGDENDEKL